MDTTQPARPTALTDRATTPASAGRVALGSGVQVGSVLSAWPRMLFTLNRTEPIKKYIGQKGKSHEWCSSRWPKYIYRQPSVQLGSWVHRFALGLRLKPATTT